MYPSLGAGPVILSSVGWPNYEARAGELLELVYVAPGGTPRVDTNQVKRLLNMRPGVSADWVRATSQTQIRARIRMLRPGRLGQVLGRYMVERGSELELREVHVVGALGAIGQAGVRATNAVATQAGDVAQRAAGVIGATVDTAADAAQGVLGGLRWSLPVAGIALGGLYMFLRMGTPPRRASTARRRTVRR